MPGISFNTQVSDSYNSMAVTTALYTVLLVAIGMPELLKMGTLRDTKL